MRTILVMLVVRPGRGGRSSVRSGQTIILALFGAGTGVCPHGMLRRNMQTGSAVRPERVDAGRHRRQIHQANGPKMRKKDKKKPEYRGGGPKTGYSRERT
jgi:hypothetical protein